MMVLSKRNYNSCKFISLAKKNSSIFSVSYLRLRRICNPTQNIIRIFNPQNNGLKILIMTVKK